MVAYPVRRPISAPAMRPFTVDPMTIPINCERTSGVNQAVSPSKMPSAPPTSKATVIRLIVALLLRRSRAAPSRCMPGAGNPLTVREEQDQSPSDEVRGHDGRGDAVALRNAQRPAQEILRIRGHRGSLEEALHVLRQVRRGGISIVRPPRHRLPR